jgi:VanZ family protein
MSFLRRKNKQRSFALQILFSTIVVIVLFFGLRPKVWPIANNILCLSGKNSLRFHNPAIAYVDDVNIWTNSRSSGEFTIQVGVIPEKLSRRGFRPILTMHDGDDSRQLTIWHWGASVIVMNGDDYDYSKRLPRVSAKDALTTGRPSLISVTSSKLGTRLFIDGRLAKENNNWQLSIPNAGRKLRLTLGNSVYGKHGWDGEIFGLALHRNAISPERVKRQYDKWLYEQVFIPDSTDDLILLYTFGECDGRLILEQTGRNPPLQIPSRPISLKKEFLSTPWHNFTPNRSFFIDAFINLIGFIPLGAVTYCWVRQSYSLPGRYEALAVVVFCFLISLSIETLQVWLPGRSSSLYDLLLNTLGAWLGVLLIDIIRRTRRASNQSGASF